ncbi:hypothetical protein NTA02_30235 [Pseudomonas aeruginosa]|uniref:hypothetical protein n=1 Tax=Pseudomonas aeruginosa TaxID=287 RepID=UPI000AD03D8E|nr:hypothetical protein [Pseudomonas aeruginosa]MCR6882116.1 hypothetical protein [Pseudomonas aeruginosa]MCR6888597.1 hypothetical protein [Pseudomonas aeruginosa]MCR6894997.1 hypothetical protein [Pseudomonas aeruginosa]MCR6901337.1 hypothetical protein [Pseudomonas aeruginosa]MCR6907802.1 hypothetical protein [Pseudomonas aeruginosa]
MPVIEQVINEDRLTFTFPAGAMATKYDDWAHYRRQFNSAFGGTKAIDLLYAEDRVGWLVEIKDYRLHVRTKPTDIADEVAHKVRDTLAGLVSAQHHATDTDERRFARKMLRCQRLRVVLHLEQPRKTSRLRPRAMDPAAVQIRLRGLLKAIDPHVCVVDQHALKAEMNWTVIG